MKNYILAIIFTIIPVLAIAPQGAFAADDVNENERVSMAMNGYVEAVRTGDIDRIFLHLTANAQEAFKILMDSPESIGLVTEMVKESAPENYKIKRVIIAKDANSAKIDAEINIAAIIKPDYELPAEHILTSFYFKKEDRVWKLDSTVDIADLDNMERPKDYKYEPDQIDLDAVGLAVGNIEDVKFEKDHTLVIVYSKDKEYAVFLVAKEELQKKTDMEMLSPGKVVIFEGHPHKTDPLKIFGVNEKVLDTL